MRRNFDMSLAGTLLMEEPHDPRLISLFRERTVLHCREIIREAIAGGIDRGQIRPAIDVDRILDLFTGSAVRCRPHRRAAGPRIERAHR
jgi:hypothetical protein